MAGDSKYKMPLVDPVRQLHTGSGMHKHLSETANKILIPFTLAHLFIASRFLR